MYMVKISQIFFIVTFCFISGLSSAPFHESFNFYSNPLALYFNPSLSVEQKGIPFCTYLGFSPDSNSFEIQSCFTIPFSNNSFSVGYNRDEFLFNKFLASYSLKHEFFYFGTVFTVGLDYLKTLFFGLDGSVSFKIYDNSFISLNVKNLIFSDKVLNGIYPGFSVSTSGGVPRLSEFFGYDFSYRGTYYKDGKKKIGSGGKFSILGKIISNPLIQYSLGFDFSEDDLYRVHKNLQGGIGTVLKINESAAGIFFGYQYDLFLKKSTISTNIYFNPTLYKNKYKPEFGLKWKCAEDGNGIYVSISDENKKENGAIKNWAMVFSSLPTSNGILLRSFSGGNNPPSTVYWDRKDSKGIVSDEEDVYVRIVISDKENNIYSSAWEKITSCNR